jgi:hypothetical protein
MSMGKRGAKISRVMGENECGFDDLQYYSSKKIPAAGKTIKNEDTQISLI